MSEGHSFYDDRINSLDLTRLKPTQQSTSLEATVVKETRQIFNKFSFEAYRSLGIKFGIFSDNEWLNKYKIQNIEEEIHKKLLEIFGLKEKQIRKLGLFKRQIYYFENPDKVYTLKEIQTILDTQDVRLEASALLFETEYGGLNLPKDPWRCRSERLENGNIIIHRFYLTDGYTGASIL